MSSRVSRVKEGSAEKHGAIWDGKGTNFTLFSANATRVEVCLFDSAGQTRARTADASRVHGRFLARLHPRRASERGVRIAGSRPVRARGGPSFQPE